MTRSGRVLIRRMAGIAEARACARIMSESEPWTTLQRTYKNCWDSVTDSAREVYVAALNGAVTGFIIVNMQCFRGYIQTIAVASEFRNRGIGAKLLGFAEKRIFRENPNVLLCVSSFNKGAQRLYKRLGYARVGVLRDYVIKGASEIMMRKTIGPISEFKPASKSRRDTRK